jgi:hypothetical protein
MIHTNQTVTVEMVSSENEIRQILSLQKENLKSSLSNDQIISQGFVTVQHTFDTLKKMNDAEPSVIAKSETEIVGYCLVMLESFKNQIPELISMFDVFRTISYQNQPLSNFNYFVMGQICIAEKFRGIGLFGDMYQKLKTGFSGKYDFVVTEVATLNTRSLRAHEKAGFKKLHTYFDHETNEQWEIILWDWK